MVLHGIMQSDTDEGDDKMNHVWKYMLIVALAFTMIACGNTTDSGSTAKVADDVVAVVNGSELKLDRLEKTFIIIEKDYMEYWGEDIMSQDIDGKTVREIVRTEILNNLINDELIKQHMETQNYTVDAEEVEKQYALFVEEELSADVEQEAFYTENGIDEAFIQESIKSQMYVQEYYKRINDDILLEEDNLEDLYSTYVIQVRARHILVEEETLAKEILAKIDAGEAFVTLAEEHSIDPVSAARGGDLDFFRRGQMVPEFNDTAFAMKPGEVSGLVKSDYGYHIIKVEETKTIQDMIDEGVEEVEVEQEKSVLLDGMIQEKANTLLADLKTNATVEKFEDRIN